MKKSLVLFVIALILLFVAVIIGIYALIYSVVIWTRR